MKRSDVVAVARDWIGTPYRHQASVRGVGSDCLGLVRGIWRDCLGPEPRGLPAYTPDWAERSGEDQLLNAARSYLEECVIGQAKPGDVLVFRMATGVPAKHCAILSTGTVEHGKIIHAYWGRSVCETWLVPWWQRRIAGAFSFPGLED